jgi:dihydrofolate reductase
MRIALIAAMANNRVIGKDNQMPWHLPEDLRYFKAMTLGKPVVMGRKTFESIGRPLPGRHNIVISRQPDYRLDGVSCVSSFEEAKKVAGECDELIVMGGGQLYAQVMPLADIMYLTFIKLETEGDTFFPPWNEQEWQVLQTESITNDDGLEYSFNTLVKKC